MLKSFGHKGRIACVGVCLLLFPLQAGAAEKKLVVLKVGSEVYSNVIVTGVTATDIYFRHAGGIGNAKLKKLSPELQKHFKFDAGKASEAEQHQREADARFHEILATNTPDGHVSSGTAGDADVIVPRLYANSYRGEHVPDVYVEQWSKAPADMRDRFVLLIFWSSTSEPCREAIVRLNKLYDKFSDRVGFIGLTGDSPEQVQAMLSPEVDFPVAYDSQQRTARIIELKAIPHVMLMDAKGIVRFEGPPDYFNEKVLARLLDKYSE